MNPEHRPRSTRSNSAAKQPAPRAAEPTNGAQGGPLPACAVPDVRTPPQFILDFRRPLQLKVIRRWPDVDVGPVDLKIGCVTVTSGHIDMALDPLFQQTWELQRLSIGDLTSTMGLAPGEKLTLEFQTTKRKVLDQESIDSVETMTSTESTTSDNEAVDIARSSTKTQGWHVDTTGTLTCGYASLSVSAGFSQNVTESNSQAIHHMSSSTRKSANSQKALHKIEVKGVTESLISNRMTRVVSNPYHDRTMSVNVFQLIKHFNVTTTQTEPQRVVLVVAIDDVSFDSDFVISNADFLRQNLLDSALLDNLGSAIEGARPAIGKDVVKIAAGYARQAVHLLFDDINMFNVPPTTDNVGPFPPANLPSNSLTATLSIPLNSARQAFPGNGLGVTLNHDLDFVFCVLNYFYVLWQTKSGTPLASVFENDDDFAITFTTTLANDINGKLGILWPDPTKDPAKSDIKNILGIDSYTEVMRRVPGSLSMVSGMLQPLLDAVKMKEDQQQAYLEAQYILGQLLQHLECNRNFYMQQFLRYVATTTRSQAIIDLANAALAIVQAQLPVPLTVADFDVDRAFIDKQQIVVPIFTTLTDDQVTSILGKLDYTGPVSLPVPDTLTDLEVPADGIHLRWPRVHAGWRVSRHSRRQ